MQSLRCAAEADAKECERLRGTLQKQEEQQIQQQQQFANLLEALELENRNLRELQVLTDPPPNIIAPFFTASRRQTAASRSGPGTRMCCSFSTITSSCSRNWLLYSSSWTGAVFASRCSHSKHLTCIQNCRAGSPAECAARKALSPRRSAFKGLLKKGMAGGKENSSGQVEQSDPVKMQQLHVQALSEVAAAAGVAAAAQGSDLRLLCLQVGWLPPVQF